MVPVPARSSDERPSDAAQNGQAHSGDPTAAYLLPFLAVLATGMLLRAVSDSFDKLYLLRPLVALGVLLWARPWLGKLKWYCSWRGIAAGLLAFAIWLIGARILSVPHGVPTAFVTMPNWERVEWLVARIGGALITVPLTEELAFRGWLMRRVARKDFDSVSFRDVGILALVVSALIFGLQHGSLWLPAVAVGLIYGGLTMRTGSLGEAVLAHGTTNALLAIYVLGWNQWQLW